MGEIKTSWAKLSTQEKIDAYNAQIDNTVREHGRMLQNRRDLSPEEKNALQTEITENANNAKAEFAKEMNAQAQAENGAETQAANESGNVSGNESGNTSGNEAGNASEGSGDGPGNGSEGGMGAGE